jgi:ATP-binding cassette, subfamily B, multidrug efflux pump
MSEQSFTKQSFIKRWNAKDILKYYFNIHKFILVIGIIALCAVNLFVVMLPLILQQGIDALIAKDTNAVFFWAFLYLAVSVVQSFLRYLWRIYIICGATLVERDLRYSILQKIFRIPLVVVARFDLGRLMALSSNDTQAVRRVFDGGVIVFLDAFLLLLLTPLIMIYLSPKLALLVLIPIPLIPLLVRFNEKKIRSRFTFIQQGYAKLMTLGQQSLSGIKTIRGLRCEDQFSDRMDKLGIDYVADSLKLAKVESALIPALESVILISLIILFLVGGKQVISGTLTIGTFIAFQRYVQQLRWPAQALGLAISIYQRGLGSGSRIADFLNEAEEEQDLNNAELAKATILNELEASLSIEINNLSYSYPESNELTLKNISLTINPGERIAILGDIGSGKSTLINILAGILDNYTGTIKLGSQNIEKWHLNERRKAVRVVPQEPFLFNVKVKHNLWIGDNLDSPNSNKNSDRYVEVSNKVALHKEITSMTDGYDTLLGERGVTLSGGQRQRLTIARAILSPSKLLLFDDVFSSVDIKTESSILNHLEQNRGQRTEIFVTHRLSTVKHVDRIVILNKGLIVAVGTHDELLLNRFPWYVNFVEEQQLSV